MRTPVSFPLRSSGTVHSRSLKQPTTPDDDMLRSWANHCWPPHVERELASASRNCASDSNFSCEANKGFRRPSVRDVGVRWKLGAVATVSYPVALLIARNNRT